MENKEKKKSKYKYTYVQFTVSEQEKEDIEHWAEVSRAKTISEFARTAIKEKIMRLKNPEKFAIKSNPTTQLLKELLAQQRKMIEMENLTQQRLTLIESLSSDMEKLKRISFDLDKETAIIEALLKANGEMNVNEIVQNSQISDSKAYKVLSNTSKFKLNIINGKFGLVQED